jgi:transposase
MVAKRRELTPTERSEIVALSKQNYSLRNIQRQLKTKRSISTIKETIDRFREKGNFSSRERSGRPRVLTTKDANYVQLLSKRDRRKTLPDIHHTFNLSRNKKIGQTAIRNALRSNGFVGNFILFFF